MLLYDTSSHEDMRLMQWLQKITNHKIRSLENAMTSILRVDTGRPLRGIKLGENFYLGRDRRFYMILHGRAQPLTTARSVLYWHSVEEIKAMFSAVAERKAQTRMERHPSH